MIGKTNGRWMSVDLMSKENSVAELQELSWGDAYTRYRPLLLHALASLARNGFFISPDEGLDLIQDFFIDAWPGLVQRYDSQRARPQTYIFRAFTQFARRQILRSRRQMGMLADVARLAGAGEQKATQSENFCESQEVVLTAIRAALAKLPPSNREILYTLLSEPRSERAVARQIGMTRYRVRELLVGALSKTIEAIESKGPLPETVRKAALSHWRQSIPLEQTARILNIPETEIRANRSKLLHQLAQTARRNPSAAVATYSLGEPTMSVQSPELFLRQLLTSPGNMDLLQEARHRSAELVAHIEDKDFAFEDADLLRNLQQHPEWAGQVFEALAGEEPLDPEEQAAVDEQIAIKDEDDRSIGQIFRNGLVRDLDPDLRNWEGMFGQLRIVSPEEHAFLASRPDVEAASPAADLLVRFGITPLTIFYAALAVKVAVDRMVTAGKIANDDVVLLTADPDRTRDEYDVDVLPAQDVVGEIVSMSEVSSEVAWAILRWLIAVAQVRAFVIPKFEAFPEGEDVRLKRTNGDISLEESWSRELVLS